MSVHEKLFRVPLHKIIMENGFRQREKSSRFNLREECVWEHILSGMEIPFMK